MTFTYTAPTPGTTDEIRFLLQDTDSTQPLFQDEEIQYFIDKMSTVTGSSFLVAAQLAQTAAGRFAREVTISGDGTSIAMEQLQQKYTDLATALRAQAGQVEISGTGGPIVGGDNWDDWYYGGRKTFTRRIHDNRQAGSQDQHGFTDWSWLDYEYGGMWDGP